MNTDHMKFASTRSHTQILAVCCVLAYVLNSGSLIAQSLDEKFSDFYRVVKLIARSEKTDAEKSEESEKTYEKLFLDEITADSLKKYSLAELEILFKANDETAFISGANKNVQHMEFIVRELEARGFETESQNEYLYSTYIKTRQFEKARVVYRKKHTHLQTDLPEFRATKDAVDGQPSEWVISQTEAVTERRKVNLNERWYMVVVSHPSCHFSRNAAFAILADPVLKLRLKGHSKWITPQDANFDFGLFQRWNRQFPDAAVSVVHQSKEWPLDRFKETPTFYFLSRGKIVSTFSGWPREGNKEKIIAALNLVESHESATQPDLTR